MGTSFVSLYFQIVLSLVFIWDANADITPESYCRPDNTEFQFWNCRGRTATFDAKAHQRVSNDLLFCIEKYFS